MNLEGKAIQHIKFGKGVVKENKARYITVIFQEGEKKFVFPEAFMKFLVLKDKPSQAQVDKMLEGLVKEENQKRAKEIKRELFLQKKKGLKVNPNAQAAFGMVSNKREDIYQSWTAYAGEYLSGKLKGSPKPPTKLKLNSACLITECAEGDGEENRRITGVFMVGEDFDGKNCKDGIVISHDKYRIKLEESETLAFWDYFPSAGKQTKWGNVEIKYFSNVTMQQILNDMKQEMTDADSRQKLEDFIEYFCYVNDLNNG